MFQFTLREFNNDVAIYVLLSLKQAMLHWNRVARPIVSRCEYQNGSHSTFQRCQHAIRPNQTSWFLLLIEEKD